MSRSIVVVALLVLLVMPVCAQDLPPKFAEGLKAFQSGDFPAALERFVGVIRDDEEGPYSGHSYFWVGRTYMAMQEYRTASDALDFFLAAYPDHPYGEEGSYQRARLFYLNGEYEPAIQRFAAFVVDHPKSDFVANALYWTGEALFALGRLEEARGFFADVVERFPTSFRVEAAQYRQDVIDLKVREEELLRLLQWSHEEYLSALDDFKSKEQEFQEALRSYRDRITGLATTDFRDEIAALNARIAELEREILDRDGRINDLLATVRRLEESASATAGTVGSALPGTATSQAGTASEASSTSSTSAADDALRAELLSLREQALELQQLLADEDEP